MVLDVAAAFERAANDTVRGASSIEESLLHALLECRNRWSAEDLATHAAGLVEAHPVMGNIRGFARRVRELEPDELAAWMRRRLDGLGGLGERLAEAAWPHLAPASRAVTVSRSSAVEAVMSGARGRGWTGEVVVLDGAPSGGGPEQAERVGGISQPDATAPRWLDGEDIVVITGADAVADERFVNASGTRALLELAERRGVPRLLVADRGKDVAEEDLDAMLTAARCASEPGSARAWPVFEAVQCSLLTLRLSEATDHPIAIRTSESLW